MSNSPSSIMRKNYTYQSKRPNSVSKKHQKGMMYLYFLFLVLHSHRGPSMLNSSRFIFDVGICIFNSPRSIFHWNGRRGDEPRIRLPEISFYFRISYLVSGDAFGSHLCLIWEPIWASFASHFWTQRPPSSPKFSSTFCTSFWSSLSPLGTLLGLICS